MSISLPHHTMPGRMQASISIPTSQLPAHTGMGYLEQYLGRRSEA